MNLRRAPVFRSEICRRLAHYAFCAVWIVLVSLFLCLALEARRTVRTTLPRSGFRIPARQNVQIGNLRFAEVINTLAERYDQTAAQAERSIQSAARRNCWLYLVSAFLSLMGFLAQWFGERWPESLPVDSLEIPIEQGRVRLGARRTSAKFAQATALAPAGHDGSFPDAGYSH
jgi:hypothetical protein